MACGVAWLGVVCGYANMVAGTAQLQHCNSMLWYGVRHHIGH
jgi:hypothetical protein